MSVNVSNDRPYVSICCEEHATNPTGAGCYWNASLFTVLAIFPKIINPMKMSQAEVHAMLPGDMVPCSNDAVCYSDSDLKSNIATYPFVNGMATMNDSVHGDLTCALDGRDYCFKSRVSVGPENVMFICKAFFDWDASATYWRAESIRNLYIVGCPTILSLLFLSVTFVIYTIVPELRNLHGLILRTYLICCFGQGLSLMLSFLHAIIPNNSPMNVFWHVVDLSTASWLNVMSFDIWWTFRSLHSSSKQSTRKKYTIYSIYGWGFPLLIFGVALIIEFLPNAPDGMIKPVREYWLLGSEQIMVYLQIPVAITIIFNIFLFVLTADSIKRQKKAMTDCLEQTHSRQYNDEKNRFYLYLKLFILMGMARLESVRAIVLPMELPKFVSFLLDLPKMLEGVLIFILFVCNVRTKRLLSKHLGLKDRSVIQWIEHAIARMKAPAR